jgi:hypothetical protein
VCLLPGTEIAFEEKVEYEPSFGVGILPTKKISQRLAALGIRRSRSGCTWRLAAEPFHALRSLTAPMERSAFATSASPPAMAK